MRLLNINRCKILFLRIYNHKSSTVQSADFTINLHLELESLQYYDIRKQCEGSLCYDFSNMESFLKQKSVREALGVGDIEFVSCSPTVHQDMLQDWMRNLEVGIPALLEDGIKLLVYAGEYDLICNWLGKTFLTILIVH